MNNFSVICIVYTIVLQNYCKIKILNVKVSRIFLFIILLVSFFSFANAQAVKRVVIDAGHGGKDPGAVGASGLKEKDVCLAVALKVGKYIEENLKDVEVIYTRKTDVFLELHQRAAIANKKNADLFISIHVNASTNRAAFGTETYVLGLHKSEANLEVAKRENAVIELEDNASKNYSFNPNSPEGHIMMSMAQNAHLDQSINLASKIQYEFTEKAKRHDRGVRQAGFFVLYKTTMPSVLVELGFLSNIEEEKYLKSALGQDYLASAIYRGFKEYKKQMDDLWAENQKTKIVEHKDIEQKIELNEGTVFRIQVFASKYKADKNDKINKDFQKVFIEDNGSGVFRHMVNEYSSYEEASKDLINVVSLGYKGAYIVSYKDGKRMQVYDVITTGQ
jgi:N-acetylmuramoyl-L-alanine amidase